MTRLDHDGNLVPHPGIVGGAMGFTLEGVRLGRDASGATAWVSCQRRACAGH